MGSCIGKCWCSCCDCGIFATHHSRASAPITEMSSSTCMLFDSMHTSSPSHGSSDARSRSDSTIACIIRSWKRKSSLSAGAFNCSGRKASQIMPTQLQQGFQLRSSSHQQESSTVSGIEFETLMCDFDIPEPTDRQVLELQSSAGTYSGGHHRALVPVAAAGEVIPSHRDPGTTMMRKRVNPGSAHIISVAYNHHACIDDHKRIEFASTPLPPPASASSLHFANRRTTTTTSSSRTFMQSSSPSHPCSSCGNRSHSRHRCSNHSPHHHHSQQTQRSSPLRHQKRCCTCCCNCIDATAAVPCAAVTSASSSPPTHRPSLDQSPFPLLDPLLSYTHETYLGNPLADLLTVPTGSCRFLQSQQQQQDNPGSKSIEFRESGGNSHSAASIGNGDAGSLDGFEWDNYDETQIKPEHDDDDDDWFTSSTSPAIATGDPVDEDESFSQIFQRRSHQ